MFCFIDPLSDMKRTIFELDAIGLAAAEKFDGVLVDERHVFQIQDQLLAGCLDGQKLLDLRDVTLVNQDAVKFLGRCEADGIKLENSPLHIRKWIDEIQDRPRRRRE